MPSEQELSRSDGRARRISRLVPLLLVICLAAAASTATRAAAAVGELSFLGCLGQLTGCDAGPAGLAGAVELPKALAVSPDGADLYAADEDSNAIDVFSREGFTGTLTLISCVGQHSGCAATTPSKAVERPEAVAVSPDGENVYAGSVGSNAVDEFARDPTTGALEYTGCIGQLSGCTPTSPSAGIAGPISIAFSPNGANVYVASANAGAVDEFSRAAATGVLTYMGCIGESGCTVPAKPNSLHVAGAVVVSPDGANVYVGGETGSIATFTRNLTTGALTFASCIGYLPECEQTKVHFAINEPLSLAISPDGTNLYAGNFNNDVVDELSRDAATGALTFQGCIGHYSEEPAACTAPPSGAHEVPEGPLKIAISPDGADLYVASDYSLSEFSRGLGGLLSYAGCVGQVSGICTATTPEEAVFFQVSLTLSPNGANLYSGDQLSHGIDEFGRVTLPACSDITAAVPYDTATALTLTCGDADGRAITYAIAGAPAHGSLSAVGPAGQVTYTPAAGYSGVDSFTFTAANADGTAEPATAHLTVGGPPGTPGASTPAPATAVAGIASTARAIEELELGCSGRQLVLNDVYIHGARVQISGSAAKSLAGRTVKILFNEGRRVAEARVLADGEFSTTAPLPPARIREALTTRYTAEIGRLRSLHLKLTRRLLLDPPKASGTTVTLAGEVSPPLTRPIAPVVVEEQLECHRTVVVKRFTPPASGRFKVTVTVPAVARAGIYTLKSSVAANRRSTRHGFTTYSLPLPVILG